MIHVGQSLQNGGDPDVALMARAIEEAGLDGVWCGDHLAFPGQWLDSPWSVMLPALRPPAWAAKQVASVQRISNGRLQLGVGLGRPGPEWQIAGTTQTGRAGPGVVGVVLQRCPAVAGLELHSGQAVAVVVQDDRQGGVALADLHLRHDRG